MRDWMQIVTGAVICMCRSAPIAASRSDDSNFRHLAASGYRVTSAGDLLKQRQARHLCG